MAITRITGEYSDVEGKTFYNAMFSSTEDMSIVEHEERRREVTMKTLFFFMPLLLLIMLFYVEGRSAELKAAQDALLANAIKLQ